MPAAVSATSLPSPEFTTAAVGQSPANRSVLLAHKVEVQKDVGATLHIEPADTPKAGEEVLAWFALTRRGGKTIPLSDCDCQLTVTSPQIEALTPALAPVNAEGYQDIPGARFTFPEVGNYQLTLSGRPAEGTEAFQAFELTFDTTVAAGTSVPTIPENQAAALPEPTDVTTAMETETTETIPTKAPLSAPLIGGGIVLLGVAIAFARYWRRKS